MASLSPAAVSGRRRGWGDPEAGLEGQRGIVWHSIELPESAIGARWKQEQEIDEVWSTAAPALSD